MPQASSMPVALDRCHSGGGGGEGGDGFDFTVLPLISLLEYLACAGNKQRG